MTITIQRRIKVGGVETDATSMTLTDAAATYGVKRHDTGEVVVSAGTAMNHDALGLYSYSIQNPVAGVTYDYAINAVIGDATYQFSGSITAPLKSNDDKWEVVTPPAGAPITSDQVQTHLRLSDDAIAMIDTYIAAAVDYAESKMECCLMPQTIRANFYDGEPLILPRGPLIAVNEVNDADGAPIASYDLKKFGHQVQVLPKSAVKYPVSITFQAGYASDIPASIKLAMLAHVGTLYEARESTTDKPRTAVPHSLDDFYRLKSRGVMIG